ncbi:hybrid signal transduction histidine kinase M [Tanacetum coccineum]
MAVEDIQHPPLPIKSSLLASPTRSQLNWILKSITTTLGVHSPEFTLEVSGSKLMSKPTPLVLISNGVNSMISSRCVSLDRCVIPFKNKSLPLRAMAHRLKNLDCEVSEKNLVIFTVNGLDSRFATLAKIIRHREPLPAFETVRNMLLLKESSFTDSADVSSMLESSSSSPTILLASSSSDAKGNNSSKPINNLQLCHHFSRGTCKFRDRCKFVNDHRNRAGLNAQTNTPRLNVSGHQNWGTAFGGSSNSQDHRVAQSRPMSYTPQGFVAPVYYTPTGPGTVAQSVALQQSQPNQSAHQLVVYMAYQPVQAIPGQNMSQPNNNGNGILGPALVLYASQPTSLLSAFSTMTLDNNCTIEFDAFGFSVKDFLTRHILLRCDSSGDLNPVTKPSTIPSAFVSTSSST